MDIVGALARETFNIDISGEFLEDLNYAPLLDLDGNPIPALALQDNGWEETPGYVMWREELSGEFKWLKQAKEVEAADKETMFRTAQVRIRRWDVEGLRPSMRVQRICDLTYFDIIHFQDDPGNGLYVNIFLERAE